MTSRSQRSTSSSSRASISKAANKKSRGKVPQEALTMMDAAVAAATARSGKSASATPGGAGGTGGVAAETTGSPWWTGSGSPGMPPPPGGFSANASDAASFAKEGGAATGGAPAGGDDTRQFWRTEYSAHEFSSVRRASERVILNLSGTSFMTTRDTLARNPQTYFAAMLRMQTPTTPSSGTDTSVLSGSGGGGGEEDATGGGSCSSGVEFFIDRDPTHFRFILNYLRDSYIGLDSFGVDDLHFLEELSHEAQFFNIAGLCADISRRMSEIGTKYREGPSGDKDFRLVQCSTGQIQDLFHEWVIEKNYEFECMQIVSETAYIVLGRRVSRGELALVERLMRT